MSRYVGFHQQDAHEFLIDLIDCLHDEMQGCLRDVIRYGMALDSPREKSSPKRPRFLEQERQTPLIPETDAFLGNLMGMIAQQTSNSSTTASDAEKGPALDDFLPTSRHFRAEVEELFTCISCGYSRSKKVESSVLALSQPMILILYI